MIECFSGDTEVLTKQGWVRFDELEHDYNEVAQYNVDTEEISFAKPLRYIHQKDRETFHYEDRNTSIFATANHNVLTKWRKGQKPSSHAFKETNFSRGNAFINAGNFENGVHNEWEARYIAMFNADGSMDEKGHVRFGFLKERKIKRCELILTNLSIEFSKRKYKRADGTENTVFYVGKETTNLINTYTDRSKTLKWSCIETLDIKSFVNEIQYWDSTTKKQGGVRFATTNFETANVTQAMLVLTNRKSTLREDFSNYIHSNGYHSKGYYLNYKPHKEETITYMSGEQVDFTSPTIQDVYCVTMPLGTLVIRHNNKVSLQHNCDYSQCELRVASWLSGDKNMQDAYNRGSDLHESTLELIFGDDKIDPEQDHDGAKRQRTQAKISNFSLVYGAVPESLVRYAKGWGVNIPLDEARMLHQRFFEAYPKLLDFYDDCKRQASTYGYSITPTGRKRFFPDIFSSNWKKRSGAERQCINTPVQGMASDLCISALADVVFSKELDHSKFTVLGSVHDAILIECKDEYAEELGQKVAEIMSHPSVLTDIGLEMPVPLKGDVEIGEAWGM